MHGTRQLKNRKLISTVTINIYDFRKEARRGLNGKIFEFLNRFHPFRELVKKKTDYVLYETGREHVPSDISRDFLSIED